MSEMATTPETSGPTDTALLADIASGVAAAKDFEDASAALVRSLVPGYADHVAVYLVEPGGALVLLSSANRDPAIPTAVPAEAIVTMVRNDCPDRPVIVHPSLSSDIAEDRALSPGTDAGPTTSLVVPFAGPGSSSGVLIASRGEAQLEFGEYDLRSAVIFKAMLEGVLRRTDTERSAPSDDAVSEEVARRDITESSFARVFDLSPLILAVTDLETGRFVAVNEAFVRATGFRRDEVIGRTPIELNLWLDPRQRTRGLEEIRSGRSIRSQEFRFRLKDGSIRDVILSAAMVEFNGRDAVLSALTDVTERNRGENLLIRYQLLARHSRDILVFFHPDGSIFDANAAACEAYGYSQDELLQMHVSELRDPGLLETLPGEFAQAMERGIRFETRHRRRDGSTFPVEVVSQSAELGGERLVLSIVRDVTDRVAVETSLRESEARFRALVETMPQLVWTCEPSSECDYLSRQWIEYTGVPEAEQLGRRWLEVVHPDDRVEAGRAWQAAVDGTADFDTEFRIRRHDGDYRWFKSRAVPVRDKHGAIVKWYGSSTDIDDLKQVEGRRRELIDTLAHDLKNPLAAIKAQSQMLRRRAMRGQPVNPDSLAMLAETATNMADLIDEMRDASQLAEGQDLELELGQVDLVSLVTQGANAYGGTSSRHKVRVETTVDELDGEWDRARLERVFSNLLANAIKYSPDGGDILVRIFHERDETGTWAVVSITDHGIGIPSTDLKRIFERHRRGGNVGRIRGNGLGLAGAADVVRLHGGDITVTSQEGSGSTFTVRLPLAVTPQSD